MDIPPRLRLRPGEERRFLLPGHGGGGYRWYSQVEGESVQVTIDFEAALPKGEQPTPARSVAQVVDIVAVRPGAAAVVLQERRSWEVGAADTRTIDVQVRSVDEPEEE